METANAGLLYVGSDVSIKPQDYYGRMQKSPELEPNNFKFTKTFVQTNLLQSSGNSTGLFEDPTDPTITSFENDESLGTVDFDVIIRAVADVVGPRLDSCRSTCCCDEEVRRTRLWSDTAVVLNQFRTTRCWRLSGRIGCPCGRCRRFGCRAATGNCQ